MSYEQLHQHFQRIAHLEHVAAYASWDEAVNVPRGGETARGEAMASLAVFIHEHRTDARIGEWLAAAEPDRLDSWQRANVNQIEREFTRATAVPTELVQASSLAASRCEQAWRTLRPNNDWNAFAPMLREVVDRKREVACALADRLGVAPYDALLDEFEPGMSMATIDPIFAELSAFLPDVLHRAVDRQMQKPMSDPVGPFPISTQRDLGIELVRTTGFDFDRGRLDASHHPFCGGTPTDVRITTRYDEGDFLSALMGVLHEAGHAKYEQGLPSQWLEQPVGHALGMAMHESQSLLQEMQLCRSPAFWRFAGPLVRRYFVEPAQESALTDDNLARLATRVRPGKIRVDADEVTYPCHVILRYELEKLLIDGSLAVSDIPECWDAEMRERLAIDTRGDYRDGCMQDVHWPAGAIGYFPTYTLGALIAAQLAAALRRAVPDVDGALARGDFQAINAWLHERVWSHGRHLSMPELLEHATGSPLSVEPFRTHLHTRYLPSE